MRIIEIKFPDFLFLEEAAGYGIGWNMGMVVRD